MLARLALVATPTLGSCRRRRPPPAARGGTTPVAQLCTHESLPAVPHVVAVPTLSSRFMAGRPSVAVGFAGFPGRPPSDRRREEVDGDARPLVRGCRRRPSFRRPSTTRDPSLYAGTPHSCGTEGASKVPAFRPRFPRTSAYVTRRTTERSLWFRVVAAAFEPFAVPIGGGMLAGLAAPGRPALGSRPRR